MMKFKKTNVYAIDALRAVSILAVVLIHTTTKTLEYYHYDLSKIPLAFILNQISRFAVPLFFLLSGFVLEISIDMNSNIVQYYKKRMGKIFIPYIFWSLIYYFIVYKNHTRSFWENLLTGSSSYQLYFIPAILLFYLLFPLFHKLYRYISNKWVLGFLGILQLYFLYRDYYIGDIHLPYMVSVGLFNFYIFLVGMVASHNQKKILGFVKRFKYIFVSLIPVMACYVIWQGKNLYYKTYDIGYFYSQWRPSILLYTLSFAALGFYFFQKTSFGKSLFLNLSKLSFFVFFVHVIILEEVWKIIGSSTHFWYETVFFILVAGASFLVAFLAHKIPYLNRITG